MRVLMVNSNQYLLPVPAMCFGLCLVSSSLEKAGYEVRVLDLCFSKNTKKDINNAIEEFQPDVIGISIRNIDTACEYNTFFQLDQVKETVIDPIKKAFSVPIVIGGTAVGISGAEMLEFFDLEFAIVGDGEYAMREFVNRIEKKKSLKGLKGLIWWKNGKIIEENPPWRVEDLDALPLSNPHRYLDLETFRRLRAPIQIQSKRGCAHNCTYCTYKTIEGNKYRLRDPQKVADEIEEIYKETGYNYFEFSDSTFNIPLDHSKAVLKAIIDKKLPNIKLRTMGLNPGDIDEEYADLMKKANFADVEVGAESGSNRMLEALGKNYTKENILRTARILHDINMPIMWYLLYGAPGETKETIMETAETMKKAAGKWDLVIPMDGVRAYKGSEIANQVLEENPDCTKDNFLRPVFYRSKDINLRDIRALNKVISFSNPNWLFPADVQRVPYFALKIQTFLMRTFAPRKPWWKFNILLNKIQRILGIFLFRRMLFKYKNRNIFRNL